VCKEKANNTMISGKTEISNCSISQYTHIQRVLYWYEHKSKAVMTTFLLHYQLHTCNLSSTIFELWLCFWSTFHMTYQSDLNPSVQHLCYCSTKEKRKVKWKYSLDIFSYQHSVVTQVLSNVIVRW